MATKADFSAEDWQVLQYAVTDTMGYMSMADPGFWDTFKEASAAAKFMAGAKAESPSLLIRDLATDVKGARDKEATQNSMEVADKVTARIAQASALVAEQAPDELEAFKQFILGVARATAEAAKGVAEGETTALSKIEAALG